MKHKVVLRALTAKFPQTYAEVGISPHRTTTVAKKKKKKKKYGLTSFHIKVLPLPTTLERLVLCPAGQPDGRVPSFPLKNSSRSFG